MNEKSIKKRYLITMDASGHIRHYVSSKAAAHFEVIVEFDIDLDKEVIIKEGCILNGKFYTTWDIRKKKNDDTKQI